MPHTISTLRELAISWSLPKATTLPKAIRKLGFVQADPIRAPARAQDLILRHRVANYRVGDLDHKYRSLKLEEDYLYAYGFMPQTTWRLLHPRTTRLLESREEKALEFVRNRKQVHPRDLEKEFGKSSERNAWGGLSKSTTRSLERLHYLGLLRVVGREAGVRLYEVIGAPHEALDLDQRLQGLALLIARILAPISEPGLRATLQHLRHSAPGLTGRKKVVPELLKSGALTETRVDGIRYVWPTEREISAHTSNAVKFLAPFDPLVWDRRRFEHLWGWPYRFEAYTPASKRKRGYYALPLLWQNDIIGWVNATQNSTGGLELKPGFVSGKAPTVRAFRIAFEEEAESMKTFLEPRSAV